MYREDFIDYTLSMFTAKTVQQHLNNCSMLTQFSFNICVVRSLVIRNNIISKTDGRLNRTVLTKPTEL